MVTAGDMASTGNGLFLAVRGGNPQAGMPAPRSFPRASRKVGRASLPADFPVFPALSPYQFAPRDAGSFSRFFKAVTSRSQNAGRL
jgi:hypothetical protein